MKHEDLCQWAMETAIQHGASDCKVSLARQRQVEIKYRLNRPESVKEATTRRLRLSIYADGRYTSQSTSDLRKTALKRFILAACTSVRHMDADPCRTLPTKAYIENQPRVDLELYDKRTAEMTIDSRHRLAALACQACREQGKDRLVDVTADASFSENETTRLATNGFSATTTATSVWLSASMTAKDDGDRRTVGYSYAGCRHIQDLPEAVKIGKDAAERTLNLLGAKKLASQTLPIIVENRVAGRLLGGLISAMEGANIQQQRSFLADKKGGSIAAPIFSIIDRPLIVRGMGSRLSDYDGFPSKPRTLIDHGSIITFLISWYYSRKMNREPTTGSVSNLTIPPGDSSIEKMMADAGRGILITDFLGGNVNPTTGDFSMGITGQLFEKGVPVQTVAEMNIADNHLIFWKKLTAVGNDPWIFGSWRVPSLAFDGVMVSGG